MFNEIIRTIKNGGLAVIPTDTIYGIVASALNKKAVERVYVVRKRTPTKPLIILISSIKDLEKFGVKSVPTKILKTLWPGKVSAILPCKNKKFEYLHRGTNKLAFRLPDNEELRKCLKKTGPIVAPSANTEGDKPSRNIKDAEKYFGADVDVYIDGGKLPSVASTIVEIVDGQMTLVRQGVVKIKV